MIIRPVRRNRKVRRNFSSLTTESWTLDRWEDRNCNTKTIINKEHMQEGFSHRNDKCRALIQEIAV